MDAPCSCLVQSLPQGRRVMRSGEGFIDTTMMNVGGFRVNTSLQTHHVTRIKEISTEYALKTRTFKGDGIWSDVLAVQILKGSFSLWYLFGGVVAMLMVACVISPPTFLLLLPLSFLGGLIVMPIIERLIVEPVYLIVNDEGFSILKQHVRKLPRDTEHEWSTLHAIEVREPTQTWHDDMDRRDEEISSALEVIRERRKTTVVGHDKKEWLISQKHMALETLRAEMPLLTLDDLRQSRSGDDPRYEVIVRMGLSSEEFPVLTRAQALVLFECLDPILNPPEPGAATSGVTGVMPQRDDDW